MFEAFLRPADMYKRRLFGYLTWLVLVANATAADEPNSHDHPMVGRFAGSEITFFKASDFDEAALLQSPHDYSTLLDRAELSDRNGAERLRTEGSVTQIRYAVRLGHSSLEVNAQSNMLVAVGQVRADCADLALVLAIDASGSIHADEFILQQHGYVGAFRSSSVKAALAAAGIVDIAVVLWGDTEFAPQILPWQRLQSAADAERLAELISEMPRVVSGNTGIGTGVATAIDLLQKPDRCAWRRIVNVSGDGIETISPRPQLHVPLRIARERAEVAGITINALAVETDDPNLSDWYRDHLITGSGAFVMEVGRFESFGEAILEKLAREIAPPVLAAIHPPVLPDSVRN